MILPNVCLQQFFFFFGSYFFKLTGEWLCLHGLKNKLLRNEVMVGNLICGNWLFFNQGWIIFDVLMIYDGASWGFLEGCLCFWIDGSVWNQIREYSFFLTVLNTYILTYFTAYCSAVETDSFKLLEASIFILVPVSVLVLFFIFC